MFVIRTKAQVNNRMRGSVCVCVVLYPSKKGDQLKAYLNIAARRLHSLREGCNKVGLMAIRSMGEREPE